MGMSGLCRKLKTDSSSYMKRNGIVFFVMNRQYVTHLCFARVQSGKFGRSAKFGQRPCLFHILMIGIKNKLTQQTVKILMRRLDFHCLQMYVRIYLLSEVTRVTLYHNIMLFNVYFYQI